MKRLSILVAAVVVGSFGLVAPAQAAGMPATPTVHIEAGLSDIVTLADSTAVMVNGTYDVMDPEITDVVVDITVGPACDGTAAVTPLDHAVPYPDGTFTAGPFDVSGFPDDALLCARATAVWDDLTLSEVGLSDNQPLLNISVAPGTVSFDEADGAMNAVEAATVGAITFTYAHTDPYVISAAAKILDADDLLAHASCDLGAGLPSSGSLAVPVACAGALPEGIFEVEVTWTDNAGNEAATRDSLLKDSISTTPTILTPVQYAQVRPAPFGMTGTAEAGASIAVRHIRYTGDVGMEVATGTAAANGTWTVTIPAMPQGNRHFAATAVDVAGNTSARSAERIVVVDATVPYIVTPVADTLQPRYFTVSGVGRPSDTVAIFAAGTKLGQTQVHPDGSWSLQVTRPSGAVTIQARGYVNGSASDLSEPRTFSVDADIPTAAIASPTGDAMFLPGNAVTLKGTAADPAGTNAGVARVRIIYTDGIRGNTIATEIATCAKQGGGACGAGATSVDWTANSMPAGPTVVIASVYAEDVAGNVSLVKAVRYTRL